MPTMEDTETAAFVDAVGGDVRVAIDDAGHHELAGGIDHCRAGGGHDLLADFGDLAVANEHGALEGPLGDGQDGGVLNDARGPRRTRRTLQKLKSGTVSFNTSGFGRAGWVSAAAAAAVSRRFFGNRLEFHAVHEDVLHFASPGTDRPW